MGPWGPRATPQTGAELEVWIAEHQDDETCEGCRSEFAYGYICRMHLLCGVCHEGIPIDAPPAAEAS